jgi:lambda family phage portal protein
MRLFDPLFRRLGYVPAQNKTRRQVRRFDAADNNRLTNDWRATNISLDSILSGDLDRLRARARDLSERNEYFQKFLTMLKTNVIGDQGMTLKNKAADPLGFSNGELIPGKLDKLANKLIEDSWWEWGKKENCTVTKKLTWTQVQHLAVEEWGTCGETLWEFVLGPEADNKFGFALRPVAIDRLFTASNYLLENGNRIRLGVEKDRNDRVVNYWLTDTDPTDQFYTYGVNHNARAHQADRFVHPFIVRRIGQSRGVPWAAASMMRLKMLQGYDIATITGAEAAACKMGFVTKTGTNVEYTGENAAGGGKYMDAEPGTLEELPQGMGIEVVDWNQPNGNYDPFTKACLRGIAAGLTVSYPTLANDYGSVNFSSGRMAQMEERTFWMFVQSCISSDFHVPIFGKWLEMALLNSAIVYPGSGKALNRSGYAKFNQPNFHGRRWAWVDPTKEVAAKAEELRLRITSHTRICAELGIDRDELFDEIQDDMQAAEARGISLPDESTPQKPEPDGDDETAKEKDSKPEKPENGDRLHVNGHARQASLG